MYYMVDDMGYVYEGTTIENMFTQHEKETEYPDNRANTLQAIVDETFTIIKGTKVKIKYIPPSYEEIKAAPTNKKPTTKRK